MTTTDIHQRLDLLPSKIRTPFKDLLDKEYLSEDVLKVVLDAGDQAGQHSKLLGFAIGYLHLRAQGIPLYDVIKMARDQGRRIRLDWTPKRWRLEHQKLSRAEALSRLVASNVDYDVCAFRKLLPRTFPGYVISNSRRLGMEGFRQRHCVAAYHEQLQNGSSAILSVFFNRKRWTVQVQMTHDLNDPLRIVQIRTQYNAFPSPAERASIHELLSIASPTAVAPERGGNNMVESRESYMDNLRRVLPVLRQHNVEKVVVCFDGSGDSGSIDHVSFEPDDDHVGRQTVLYNQTGREFVDGDWITAVQEVEKSLHDAIFEITDDYTAFSGVDWYNNDGGFGELVIDVVPGTVRLEVNSRFTESSCEFDRLHNIETGVEIDQ